MANSGNPEDGRTWSAAEEQLALLIASGNPVNASADQVGMGRRTAYRKWADPQFKGYVKEVRAELVAGASGRLSSHMTAAADKLAALMQSGNEPVALGAARTILQMGYVAFEQEVLAERLAEVERRLENKDNR